MKKIISLFFGLGISILVLTNSAFAFYSDVPSTHKYYKEIKTLSDEGMLPEEANNMFMPDSPLKMPDLYKFIITYGKAPLSINIKLPYLDTKNDADYAPYLQTAIDLEILKYYANTEFGVNMSVAKRMALETMFQTLGIGINQLDRVDMPFRDISEKSELAPLAKKAYEMGIIEEGNQDMFKMGKTITRGEAANYLYLIEQYNPTETIKIEYIPAGSADEITEESSFGALSGVYSALKDKYLYQDEINKDNLVYDAINGMISEVKDKYTVFQKPSPVSILDTLSSEYEGVGMSLDLINNNITVVSPFKDSPAEKAGIKANDIIIKIDDKSVIGESVNNVAIMLRGKKGTTVKVTVLRNGQEMTFTLTRELISYKSVQYEVKKYGSKNIAYINVINFGEATYSEFKDAARNTVADKTINGIVVDLRNNPGGYMDTAIDMISLFTKDVKTAVKLKFANGNITEYKTSGLGTLAGYKTVVLINEGSASASEIFAGALKDYGVATLMGKKSFGKGSVQEVSTFSDGSLFKYTISYWLTPNGTNINKAGILPDKIVENVGTTDTQLNTALSQF